jgi:hypothetical protein
VIDILIFFNQQELNLKTLPGIKKIRNVLVEAAIKFLFNITGTTNEKKSIGDPMENTNLLLL